MTNYLHMTDYLHMTNYLRIAKRSLIATWKKQLSAILPYHPMEGKREVLEAEYAKGSWDYLRSINELPRFNIVAGYCHYFNERGTILEIGCGEGILQEKLNPDQYKRYVGVDISAEAICRAVHKQNEKNLFLREDASTFSPTEKFDTIVFNECLEYFEDPKSLVKRYEPFLEENGIFVVSMFAGLDTVRTKRIWRMLESIYLVKAKASVSTRSGYLWNIKVLVPSNGER